AFASIFASVLPARAEPPHVSGWSLRSWSSGDPSEADLAPLESAELPHTALVGCGAIGQAISYALARSDAHGGPLALIDPQTVSSMNLQRYVGSVAMDATNHVQKVVLAARTLGNRFVLERHAGRDWAAYRRQTEQGRRPELVLTA